MQVALYDLLFRYRGAHMLALWDQFFFLTCLLVLGGPLKLQSQVDLIGFGPSFDESKSACLLSIVSRPAESVRAWIGLVTEPNGPIVNFGIYFGPILTFQFKI